MVGACYLLGIHNTYVLHAALDIKGLKAVHHSHLDGQHDMCVALQHLHSVTVADVLKAYSIGSQDLVPHLYPILLSQASRIQPEATRQKERSCHD